MSVALDFLLPFVVEITGLLLEPSCRVKCRSVRAPQCFRPVDPNDGDADDQPPLHRKIVDDSSRRRNDRLAEWDGIILLDLTQSEINIEEQKSSDE